MKEATARRRPQHTGNQRGVAGADWDCWPVIGCQTAASSDWLWAGGSGWRKLRVSLSPVTCVGPTAPCGTLPGSHDDEHHLSAGDRRAAAVCAHRSVRGWG